MTSSEIKYALSLKGFSTDEWTPLCNSETGFGSVGLAGDNNIYVNPTRIYFYFDTTDEILYLMYVHGKPSTTNIYNNGQAVTYNGKVYYFAASDYYINIHSGKVTDCVKFDAISALY